ncbi:MAG: serine peptidase [Myxococcaceae bacterium]|nr:serine peptidase [Myxococcaceae bacterium]
MRMYLSSYQIGPAARELSSLLRERRRALIIGNALDGFGDELRRRRNIARQVRELGALGCSCTELDLRHYFGRSEQLRSALACADLLWVHGGNSFVLKRAFEQSGAEPLLRELLQADALVYGGFSAAAMMVMPSLRGMDRCDEPDLVPPGYRPEFHWQALGLLPYAIVPHYRSKHPEAALMERAVAYLREHDLPYRTLRDGEALVVEHGRERLAGYPTELYIAVP